MVKKYHLQKPGQTRVPFWGLLFDFVPYIPHTLHFEKYTFGIYFLISKKKIKKRTKTFHNKNIFFTIPSPTKNYPA